MGAELNQSRLRRIREQSLPSRLKSGWVFPNHTGNRPLTQRYAHRSPAHELDAVERLTWCATGTRATRIEWRGGQLPKYAAESRGERATGVEPATSSLGN
jgi:hypothetical protein